MNPQPNPADAVLAQLDAEIRRLALLEEASRSEAIDRHRRGAAASRAEARRAEDAIPRCDDEEVADGLRRLVADLEEAAARDDEVVSRCQAAQGLGLHDPDAEGPPPASASTRLGRARWVRDLLRRRCRRWAEVRRAVACPDGTPSGTDCRVKVRLRVPCQPEELPLMLRIAGQGGLEGLCAGPGFVDASLPLERAHVGADGRLYGWGPDGALWSLDGRGRLSKVKDKVKDKDNSDADRPGADGRVGLQGEDSMSATPEYIPRAGLGYEEAAFDAKPIYEAMGDVSSVDAELIPGGNDDDASAQGAYTADDIATGPSDGDGDPMLSSPGEDEKPDDVSEEFAPGPYESGSYDDRGSAGFEDLSAGNTQNLVDRRVESYEDPWEGGVGENPPEEVVISPAPSKPRGHSARLHEALSRRPSVDAIMAAAKGRNGKGNGNGRPNGNGGAKAAPGAPGLGQLRVRNGMGQLRPVGQITQQGLGQAQQSTLSPDQQAFANLFGGLATAAGAIVPAALGRPATILPGQPGYVPPMCSPGTQLNLTTGQCESNIGTWVLGGVVIAGVLGLAWWALKGSGGGAKIKTVERVKTVEEKVK